jgi:hypothetical protein
MERLTTMERHVILQVSTTVNAAGFAWQDFIHTAGPFIDRVESGAATGICIWLLQLALLQIPKRLKEMRDRLAGRRTRKAKVKHS